MNMVLDATPVMYMTPDGENMAEMPLAMLITLVPNSSLYTLEHAAKLAHVRDEYEAENLLASILGEDRLLSIPYPLDEEPDYLSIQPPSIR